MLKITLIFLASFLLAPAVQADVYKCRQPNGSVEISNSPCSNASSTVKSIPADTVSKANREQAERDAERMEQYADKLQTKRLAQEESERKEREKQAAAAALVPPGPSAASIESCLRGLDRMALDPARRNALENACRTTGVAQAAANPEPYYYGVPVYVQPYPPRQHPKPLPKTRPSPPGAKPVGEYQAPNNYKAR